MTTEFSRVENTVACILARKIAYHFGKHFLAALILLASLAGVASSEINLPEITKAYVEAAFPPGIDRLRKIENSDHVSYRLDCADGNMQRCNDALKYFRATIFENPNMKLEQNEFGLRVGFDHVHEQHGVRALDASLTGVDLERQFMFGA